jgi:hypothetical protein
MGGPRAGADTQSLGTSTSSAGSAERLSLPGRRCLAPLAVYLLAGAALFTVYLRLSETSAPNSDSANILWMFTVSWYDPKLHYANFIVLDSRPGLMSHWDLRALVRKYFGRPARIFHTGPYTVLVWDRNLLLSIPR